MTLLVRDEVDVVAANLDFHLAAGVDFVIATDNRSVDGTTDILRAYEERGVLRLIDERDDDYAQARWVTRMARLAATDHGADWVVNNDADEFWWPHGGDLRAVLADAPASTRVVSVPRFNFVARPDAGDGRPFWRRMTVRQREMTAPPGIDAPNFGPKAAHRAHPAASVLQGNHEVGVDGEPGWEAVATDRIEIFHFPVRSRAQMENKIRLGGAAYARNTELPPGTGKTWRDLYSVQQGGGFGEAYGAMVLPEEQIDAGLASGALVTDTRLRDRLDELQPGGTRPSALA